jgi:hypothetical protein
MLTRTLPASAGLPLTRLAYPPYGESRPAPQSVEGSHLAPAKPRSKLQASRSNPSRVLAPPRPRIVQANLRSAYGFSFRRADITVGGAAILKRRLALPQSSGSSEVLQHSREGECWWSSRVFSVAGRSPTLPPTLGSLGIGCSFRASSATVSGYWLIDPTVL